MPGFRGAKHGRDARYGPAHQAERRRLTPIVNRGDAWCQQGIPGNGSSGTCIMPTRHIQPGTPWALGHNDAGTAWIGPVHKQCNTRDAAQRGQAASRPNPFGTFRVSRTW